MNSDVLNRLKTAEGHIRGIERMVEDDVYCIEIIKQIQAVQAALGRVANLVLEGHLNSCVITAVRGDDPNERERVLVELSEIFQASQRK